MNDIIRDDNPALRQIAERVDLPMSEEDKRILISMGEYLSNSQDEELSKQYNLRPGVGLAAPQINVLKRMLAILTEDEQGVDHFYLMVNPKLIGYSDEMTYMPGGEGCLSVDRVVEGYVPRYKKVTIDTHLLDPISFELRPARIRLKDFIAVVFQHELDHLNGILFYDRIDANDPLSPIPNGTPVRFSNEE